MMQSDTHKHTHTAQSIISSVKAKFSESLSDSRRGPRPTEHHLQESGGDMKLKTSSDDLFIVRRRANTNFNRKTLRSRFERNEQSLLMRLLIDVSECAEREQ